MKDRKGLSNGQKAVIISMLSVVALLLIVAAVLLPYNGPRKANSRTVMIFMAGTNLESNNMIASSDLNSIVPSSINFDDTKVLLYTGGTKRWHNFVNSEEDAIYELTKDGFKKVKVYNKSNLGIDNALSNFLNYSYKYSKTDKYDLIFWNHGLGAIGSISDENTNDYLDLSEISSAFKRSPFNEKNKLEAIVFRTCLNATVEVAGTVYPYADYMIASEEVTIGKTGHGVLNFLNDVKPRYDGKEFGKTFISAYQKQVKEIDLYGSVDSTYSIIDLSKVPELITMLDNFFSKIDVRTNYNDISRIRSNMHQYGETSSNVSDYDTVDLYELIDKMKNYNKTEALNIENYLKKNVILYNWSTNYHSNGLSIYFPFSGNESVKKIHLSLYNRINVSNNYKKFITDFYNGQTTTSYNFSFDLSNSEVSKKGTEFKLKLTDDQVKNFSKASYIIFRKEEDGQFMPLYAGRDATLDKDGYVTTNITNNIIKVVDDEDHSSSLFTVYQVESNSKKYKEYTVPVLLNRKNKDGFPIVENANVHLKVDKKNKVHVDEVYLVSNEKDNLAKASGTLVDLKDYSSIDFSNFRYKILDENGNYTTDWGRTGVLYMWEVTGHNYHFEVTSLEKSDDYYCVFVIRDVQNKAYYSNLISIE